MHKKAKCSYMSFSRNNSARIPTCIESIDCRLGTIVLKDKLRRAWDRWNYAEDQAGFPDSGIRAFKASKHLAYYNCEEKTFAVAQVVYLDEKGKSLGQINVDVNPASFSVVVPDSVSEAQLRFVCAAKLGAKP